MKKNTIRAAITGAGVITPVGIGLEAFAQALFQASQSLSELVDVPTPRGKNKVCLVKDPIFNKANRAYLMAEKAIQEAIACNGSHWETGEEVGLVLSTISGDSRALEDLYPEFARKSKADNLLRTAMDLYPNGSILHSLGYKFGLFGPRLVVTNACASGNIAMGLALDMIRQNRCKKVIVCGVEILKLSMIWGAERAGFMGTTLRPFHQNRDGAILGEGAGALILESEETTKNKKILGWLEGFGCACDRGAAAITLLEDGSGLHRSMSLALMDAGRKPEEITYYNAHAPGTPMIDRIECAAIARLKCVENATVHVNSTKSVTGHLSGASAIVETVAVLLQIKYSLLHANAGLDIPDPGLALRPIDSINVACKVKAAVSNACGGGGLNTSVILTAPEQTASPSSTVSKFSEQIIVISGVGSVSSLGTDTSIFQRELPLNDPDTYLEWFDIYNWYDKSTKYGYFNRSAQLAAAAGAIAWIDASTYKRDKPYPDDRIAIIAGTYLGGGPEASAILCERLFNNPNSILPSMSLDHGLHLGSALIARHFGLTGLTYTLTGTFTAGLQAVIAAVDILRNDRADMALALGYDSFDHSLQHAISLYDDHKVYSKIGEGAGSVLIERGKPKLNHGSEEVVVIREAVTFSGSFKSPSGIRQLAERLANCLADSKWKVLYLATPADSRFFILAEHLIALVEHTFTIQRLQPLTNFCMAADPVIAIAAAVRRKEHALILSADPGGTVAALVIATCNFN